MANKFFYIVFFVAILALTRIIPHPPNFTPILASAIIAPLLIRDRLFGMAIPIFAMFLSDIIIGFHPYQFVIYSSLLLIALVSPMHKNYFGLGLMAIGGSVFFFITSNFAVWIIWDYYPKTIDGLINCYTLAIPFFKNTLISTCLFTALFIFSIKYIELVNKKFISFTSNILLKA